MSVRKRQISGKQRPLQEPTRWFLLSINYPSAGLPPLFGLSAFVSLTCKWLSDCYHHDIIINGKLKISTLEFLKCQSGGEFSLAIISSLRSWQGRRHSFESMPDCQRHIWLKLFHNFARAPRFSTEID